MSEINRKLPVLLEEPELVKYGEELAHVHKHINTLMEDKARITAAMKPHTKRIEELVVILDTKSEEQEVKCRWDISWTTGIKTLFRTDTWEEVETDLIRESERQQHLFETGDVVPAAHEASEGE